MNDISVIINHVSNFGSDGATFISASSDGNTSFDASDRWVITDDRENGGDPTNTTVFFGPDSPASSTEFTSRNVFACAGVEGLNARIDLTIPAGEQRSLMFFHSLANTGSNALANVWQFETTPPVGSELVEGLTEEQLQNVANWTY